MVLSEQASDTATEPASGTASREHCAALARPLRTSKASCRSWKPRPLRVRPGEGVALAAAAAHAAGEAPAGA